jgi:hypothetical protein
MIGSADRRIGGLILLIVIAQSAHPPSRLSAQQVAPNRATAYLFPTDVRDARAIWVNPAGLGVQREASIYAEAVVGDPGAQGRLRQVNAGFNARGLSFGYQRDMLDDGQRGHTYRFGLAGGSGGLAAGFDVTHYRGDGAKATAWDVGASYLAYPSLNLGLVVANIGQPVVRGLPQRLTYVPGATWHPGRLGGFWLSTYARINPDSVERYAFGVTWRTVGPRPIEVIARMDTDGGFRRAAFVLGLSIGGQNRVGAIVSSPGDVSRLDGASLYGLATREPSTRRH